MKELTEKEALNKAAFYCSTSEHCPQEVIEKLKRWGIEDEEVQQRIVIHLIQEHYIDEMRFCRFFINDKYRFNKWGKRKIYLTLKQKSIPESIISEALESIDEEEYNTILTEVLKSKLRNIKQGTPYELYGKLMRFAMSKGFDMEESRKAIRQMIDTPDD